MNQNENYFTFAELTATDTGLDNSVSSPCHLANLSYLWHNLNLLRAQFGKSIIVNSAFRTHEVNEQVNGSKCSYHMQGRAADICSKSVTDLQELWSLLELFPCKEKILYDTFIHVAF